MLATVVPAFLLVLAELALRLADYGYPTAYFVEIPGRRAWTSNQKFGWRFFPPAIARTPIPCRLAAEKPPRTYRIFILGESAAMGEPNPAFSFGRILEAVLRDRYPEIRFEVINTAMTAINSHVILRIARECARHEPDLFILYIGHNEVVGPYGSGTVFNPYSPCLPLIRADIRAQSTRLMQLAENAGGLARKPGEQPRDWGGMAMFLRHAVASDDPRMENVYAHFRGNLGDICRTALSSGAQVILSTVAANLRDSPPFASLHRGDLAAAGKARWERACGAGTQLAAAGDCGKAVENFREAAALDDRYAEIHYRLARCLLALNRPEEARRHFVRARDLDALRFRADSRINDIIRETGRSFGGPRLHLVDAERAFERSEKTAHGIPGEGLLYEHVHLNFSGSYLLARVVLERLAGILPARDGPLPAEDKAAELAGLTGWDRYRIAANIHAIMEQPPFTDQLDHARERALREARLRELENHYASPEALREAARVYRASLERAPEDLLARLNYAELLGWSGDHAGAAGEWRALIARGPEVAAWRAGLAGALRDAGKLGEAVAQYEEVLRSDPEFTGAQFGLGAALEKGGDLQGAAARYREALRLRPAHPEAHNNLGIVLTGQGKVEEAIAHFSEALRLKPGYAEAHHNLGLAWTKCGAMEKAIEHYDQAVLIKPDFAAARYALAGALAGAGRLPEATVHYAEALRARPDYAEAHHGLGAALAAAGRPEEAMYHFAEAVRIKPRFVEAHFNMGLLQARAGKLKEAIDHYSEALLIRPDYAEAHNNMGTALARSGQTQRALAHLARALGLKPDYAEAHFNFGLALAGLGRTDEAIRHYGEALRIQPGFLPARARLAEALSGKGPAPRR